jgi:hypothetical protein
MAKIANVALTNTFDTWRSRSNEAFDRLSQFAINNSSLYANTLTANSSFTSKGLATMQGRATVGTNLTVSGNTTFGPNILGLVNIAGRAAIGTNLTVSGNTTLGGASKTLTIGGAGATANATGWFGVNGRASVGTNLFVGGNTIIGSSGRLGIGVAAPDQPLHVYSTAASALYNHVQHSGAYNAGIHMQNVNGTWYSYIAAAGNQYEIYGGTSPTVQLSIAGSGLVTTGRSLAVTQNLTVSGNTTLNGTTTDKSNALSQTLTDGATINWDVALGRVATVTLGAAGRTMAAPTNLKVGTYILRVYQDGTGSRTITTWNSIFKWTAAVAPVLSTGANKLDIITFFSDGTNLYGSYLPDMR